MLYTKNESISRVHLLWDKPFYFLSFFLFFYFFFFLKKRISIPLPLSPHPFKSLALIKEWKWEVNKGTSISVLGCSNGYTSRNEFVSD